MPAGDEQNTKIDDALERQWNSIRERLRVQLGDPLYQSWFSKLDLVSMDGGDVTLMAPTHFIKTWIELHHLRRIEAEFQNEFGGARRILILHRAPAL